MQTVLQIQRNDTVAVALRDIPKGAEISLTGTAPALKARDSIPAGHKIALSSICAGETIIKYGAVVGVASQQIAAGSWVHTHNMQTRLHAEAETYPCPARFPAYTCVAAPPLIKAYRRSDGSIAIRNELWIIPTVGCVNKTAEKLARWAVNNISAFHPNLPVFAWTHPYGCSQMGEDHAATATILSNLARHPHAAGVLIVSLGCENNTPEQFKNLLGTYAQQTERIAFLNCQEEEDEIGTGITHLKRLAAVADGARREEMPASELVVGMKCGGSDGFSGITANPLIGWMSDILTGMGATVILSEVPEMFGAETMLLNRCENRTVFDQTVALIEGFKNYYRAHNQVVYENPSPGNKAGGITTLEEKSCGCVQKGGAAVIRGVYRYSERLKPSDKRGLVLLEGPGNDIVSTTALSAAGAHLILFSTGRGTPLGAPVPTVKIASNTALAQKKSAWIDFDAGRLLTEDASAVRDALFALLLQVVDGTLTKNECYDYREIALFKNGVTL
ncbi:MAG: altronate dehydratase family protein [Spirochaetaceae bacterium]|jgi:altronate hydrolase|nr:altronate dehydratase family protein [Spirochaetaceae bacterium]